MEYQIGDIRKANEVGLKSSYLVIYSACQSCGKSRWIQYVKGKPLSLKYCKHCVKLGEYRPPPKPSTLRAIETGIKKCNKCAIEYPATNEYFPTAKGYLRIGSPCRKCCGKRTKERMLRTGEQKYESYKVFNEYQLKYHPYRTVTPIEKKLHTGMRASICRALKGNKNGRHWETLVGYSVKALKRHIEKQFVEGMSWENHGKCNRGNTTLVWHIDHIIPKSAFRISSTDDIDFKRCWALSNLRPMWGVENCIKSNKITQPFQFSLQGTSSLPPCLIKNSYQWYKKILYNNAFCMFCQVVMLS